MPRKLYVNLPVKELERTVDFFAALGFSFNPTFTNENATCMVINDNTSVMLLVEPFFSGFTNKPIVDAHAGTEVLLALSLDSRDEVDAFITNAVAAGASRTQEAKDYGFMYQHAFADLDGHQWEVFWMDETRMPAE